MRAKTRQRKRATSGVMVTASKTARSPLPGDGRKRKVLKSEKLSVDEQYRELFDGTSDLIQSVAPDGRFLYTNKAWRDVLGYSKEEIVHLKIWDIISPESMDHCIELFKRVMAGEHVRDIEAVFVAKDGSQITVEGNSQCRLVKGKPVSTQGFFRDVTKRKLAEEALRQSEERYRTLFNSKLDGMCVMDETMKVLLVNQAAVDIFGFDSIDEALGANPFDFIPPEERERVLDIVKRDMFESDLRQLNEFRLINKSGKDIWVGAIGALTEYQGKLAGLISFRDITERKWMEEVLRQSEERYRTVLEQMEEAYYEVDLAGNFTFFNDATCRQLGYSREELMGMNYRVYTSKDDVQRVYETFNQVHRTGKPNIGFPVSRVRKDGALIFTENSAFPLRNGSGKIIGFRGVVRDITERKRLEEYLEKERQDFRLIVNSAPIIIFYKDKKGRFVRVNKAFAEALKMPEEEFVGKTVFDFYSPKIARGMTRDDKEVFKSGLPKLNIIEQYESASGLRWVQTDKVPIFDNGGNPFGILGFAQDITDRRRAEEELQENENRLQTIFSTIQVGVLIINANTHEIVDANPRAVELIGTAKEKIVGSICHNFVCPAEKGKCPITDMGQAVDNSERILINASGKNIPIIKSVKTVTISGQGYLVESFLDITELKRAEETLANEAIRRRILIEQSRDGIVVLDENGKVYEANQRFAEMLGYSPKEARELHVWDWEFQYPREQVQEMIRSVDEKGDHFETRHRRKDGTIYDVEISTNGAMFAGHKLVFCVCRDITEHKRSEEELRQSEERYRTVLEEMEEGYFEADLHGNFTVINEATCYVMGYPKEEIIGISYRAFLPEEHIDAVFQAFNQVYQTGKPIRQLAWEVLRRDGGRKFIEASISPLRDNEGQIVGFRGIGRDITERRRAEEALRSSEQNFRDSIESSPLGIHVVDKDGKHIYANRAFLNIWGYNSIEELQAVPRKQRYTPQGYAEHMEIIKKRKRGEDAPLNYEISIVRSDGQTRYLSASRGELLWNGGRQFQVVYQDITEHRQAEEKVKKLYSLQTAIRYINESLLKVDDEPALFEQVCHFLTDVEFIKFCWIGFTDKESLAVKPVAYSGFEDGYLSLLKINLGDKGYNSRGPIVTAIKTSQPCTIADIENDPGFPPWRQAALERGYASSLAVPLIHDTEVIGILSVYSGSKGAFGDAEINFLAEAAGDIALGIRTLRLRRELQQSLDSVGKALEGTVNALASVAEIRDPYTAGHQQRVTRLAVAIATEMGLPQEQIEGIHVAGTLHDVGKLYVPAEILSKPGKLSELEFNLVKLHSQASYDILKTVEFPWPVAQIVLQHHERLDGSGYPQGLKGEDILLEAKILAVADVVEAMASHRPYRPALGIGQALDEISKNSGILYDPKVVDACFKLFYEEDFKFD